MPKRVMRLLLLLFAALSVSLVGLVPAQADPMQSDGPHASADRVVAPTEEVVADGVRVLRFDFGNLDLTDMPGEFVTPLRGSLVTPEGPGPHPLVVINHLRSFGCTGEVFTYPCPDGSQEIRLDQGMEYLGIALAKQGRAVLIPDLSPTLLAASATSDYPMGPAVAKVLTAQRDRLLGEANAAISAGPAALITHSRSGLFAPDLIDAWRESSTPITSLLAVAPAYDLGGPWTPAPPDIPYLGLYGRLDDDVPHQVATYLTYHLGAARQAPALAVQAPGYGHMFFNSALRDDDDRKACDEGDCATGEQHEALLIKAARDWIDAVPSGQGDDRVPRAADAVLPTTLWGEAVMFVALTPGEHLSLLAGTEAEASAMTVTRGTSEVCRVIDPANPQPPPDQCPEPREASVLTQDIPLRRISLEADGALTYQLPATLGPTAAIALHVSPVDDQPGGHPLRLTLSDAAGAHCSIDLPGDHPALANRATASENASFVVGTIRTPVCAGVAAGQLSSVSIGAPTGSLELLVRGVDMIPPPVQHDTTTAPAEAPTPRESTTPATGWVWIGGAAVILVVAALIWRRK